MAFGRNKKDEVKNGTAVVAQKGNAMVVVSNDVPDYLRGQEAYGNENVMQEDLAIPRLEIVQGLSPAITPNDPGFIEDAQQGMLNNSASRELYGDVVHVINVYFTKQWLVWRNRKLAADKKLPTTGFFGAYPTEAEARERCEEEGGESQAIEVIDTPQHLCLLLDVERGKVEEVIISMPRTKAKVSRQWNTVIRLAGGARFGRVYAVGTTQQKIDNNTFYNYSVKAVGFPSKKLFADAEALYKRIVAGEKRVVMDVKHMTGAESGGDADARM